MSENLEDRYTVYILNVPIPFSSDKLTSLLKSNGINATLVYSPPQKSDKFEKVKAVLDNAEGKSFVKSRIYSKI